MEQFRKVNVIQSFWCFFQCFICQAVVCKQCGCLNVNILEMSHERSNTDGVLLGKINEVDYSQELSSSKSNQATPGALGTCALINI